MLALAVVGVPPEGADALTSASEKPGARSIGSVICTDLNCLLGPEWLEARGPDDVDGSETPFCYWGAVCGHNCTNYVAWRQDRLGIANWQHDSGSAHLWDDLALHPYAQARGVVVNQTAAVGAIAQWNSPGHVALVEAINGSTITISQDRYDTVAPYDHGPYSWATVPITSPSNYIHVPGLVTSGSSATRVLAPGDWDGDGFNDVLHIRPAGLYLYRGNGSGGFINPSGGTLIGASWDSFKKVLTPGDWDGDAKRDLLAIDNAGTLWLYRGNGSGGFAQGSGVAVGSSWQSFKDVIAPGDFTGDGKPDLMAVATSGALYLYPGNGTGGFLASSVIGSGWSGFTKLVTPGDWSGDGKVDVLGVVANGDMYRYTGNGAGGWATTSVLIGTSWTFREVVGTRDFNGNATADVLAVTNGGTLYVYNGNGSGGFGSSVLLGASGW